MSRVTWLNVMLEKLWYAHTNLYHAGIAREALCVPRLHDGGPTQLLVVEVSRTWYVCEVDRLNVALVFSTCCLFPFDQSRPFIDRASNAYVKELIEPMMNDVTIKPSVVSSLRFTSFTLGTLPPKVRGIKIYSSEMQSKELVMEVDIAWGGNQNIAIKATPTGPLGYLFAAEVGIGTMEKP